MSFDHTTTVIATDSKGATKELLQRNVIDVSPSYTRKFSNSNQSERAQSGTVILNSAVGNFSNPVYSISGGDSKFAINSETGQVTLTSALDYETATSHATITANRRREYFTKLHFNVDDYTHTLIDSASSTSAVKNFRNNVTYVKMKTLKL